MKLYLLKSIIILICSVSILAQTPVEKHGLLTVEGNKIADKNDMWVSFAGMSFYWSTTSWGGNKYYNQSVVKWLKDDWNVNIIRAAIGVDGSGNYLSDSAANMQRAINLIEAAIDEGVYILVDWHSHTAENNAQAAVNFFKYIATQYGTYENIIYEIYNEPLQVSWTNVIKPYALNVIGAIRDIDPDNLIVVGTPTWSQDVDAASLNPITEFSNIAYTLHFYAGTHKGTYRAKAQTALNNGIALMVTEWGTVNSDGNGSVDVTSTNLWMDFLKTNGISHLNWVVNDKQEGASILNVGASTSGNWSENDFTTSGKFVKSIIQSWGTGFIYPEAVITRTDPDNGKIINIELSEELSPTSISKPDFQFTNGNININIDSIVIHSSDAKKLKVYLNSTVLNTDDSLAVKYIKGNLESTNGLKVQSFTQKVFNLLPGSSPEVISAYTDSMLNNIYIQFSKKMSDPTAFANSFHITINSETIGILNSIGLTTNDSSILFVNPKETIISDDTLWISFDGINYSAKDGGILKSFDSVTIKNNEAENPIVIEVSTDIFGEYINVKYSENISDTSVRVEDFWILVNDTVRTLTSAQLDETNYKIIVLELSKAIEADDICIIRITANGPISLYQKPAIEFGPDTVINIVIPTITIPGRVEAEDFVVNSGFQTESTTDEGGGLNLGYTDAGDYLEYNIIVPYTGAFTVYYRISALSALGQIELKANGIVKDTAYVPITGGWQNWTTICGCIDLEEGLNTIRVTALTDLFNLNWYEFEDGCNSADGCNIDPKPDNIHGFNINEISLYPNPASDYIIIKGEYLNINHVIIKDINGRIITNKVVTNNSRVNISDISEGFYFIEVIYNEDKSTNYKLVIQ